MGILDFLKGKSEKNNKKNGVKSVTEDNVINNNTNTFALNSEQMEEMKAKKERQEQLQYVWKQYIENKNNFDKESLIYSLEEQYGKNHLDDLDCDVLKYFNMQQQVGNLSSQELEYMENPNHIPGIIDKIKFNAIVSAKEYGYTKEEAGNFISFSIQDYIDSKNVQENSKDNDGRE